MVTMHTERRPATPIKATLAVTSTLEQNGWQRKLTRSSHIYKDSSSLTLKTMFTSHLEKISIES